MRSTLTDILTRTCLVLSALAYTGTQAIAEIVEIEVEGIRNYSSYSGEASFAGERVGFGGATSPEAMEWLKQQGYTTVINLRQSSEDGADVAASREAAEKAGLTYIHLPFDPGNPAPDLEQRFLDATGKSANQPVYIHCGSATRAAAMWMTGRALVDHAERGTITSEGARIAEKPEFALQYFSKRMAAEQE